jgi:hypothetical protein
VGGGRPAWAAPRRRTCPPTTRTSLVAPAALPLRSVVCPVRRSASAHGTLRRCSWRAAVRAYPPPLAASLDSRLAGRCRPTDGSEQVDDRSGSANLSTILAGCRETARVRAVHTALPAWLILLRGLTDACLPARALVAKMGMLRWVCYGPEPRSASLGLPFDCIFSPYRNTVTWPSGHVPAADSPGLRTAASPGSLTDGAGAGRSGSAVVLFL